MSGAAYCLPTVDHPRVILYFAQVIKIQLYWQQIVLKEIEKHSFGKYRYLTNYEQSGLNWQDYSEYCVCIIEINELGIRELPMITSNYSTNGEY